MSAADSRVLLDKKYYSEELCDLSRDVDESLDPAFTPSAADIPVDNNGFHEGHFQVTITWVPEEV